MGHVSEGMRREALSKLGLPRDADIDDVKAAWRRVAFETHPDRNDGSTSAFVAAKAAYDLLRAPPAAPANAPERPKKPARPTPRRPHRPSGRPRAEARDQAITEEMRAECELTLIFEAPPSDVPCTDHIPSAVYLKGRSLTYLVESTLRAGKNRVAVPTAFLEDTRKINPKIVSFNVSDEGPSEIEVPAKLREKLFPGARSVHLRFGEAV